MIYKTFSGSEEEVVVEVPKSINTFDGQACIQALKKHFE